MSKIMTKYVHRLIDGLLVTAAPGEPAPAWVTNASVFRIEGEVADAAPAAISPDVSVQSTENVDLGELKQAELRDIAKNLGLSTNGSKQVLVERIQAHRDAPAEQAVSDDIDEEASRKVAAAAAQLGREVDDLTEAERLAILEMEA